MKKLILCIFIITFFTACSQYDVKRTFRNLTKSQYDIIKSKLRYGSYKDFLNKAERFDFTQNMSESKKKSLFLYALSSKYKPCMKTNYMIKKGLKFTDKDEVFHRLSSWSGTLKGLQCIVKLGVNKNYISSYSGNNVLHEVVSRRYSTADKNKILQYLITLGVDSNVKNSSGLTALDLAIARKNKTAIKLLKDAGASSKDIINGLTMQEYIEKNKLAILTEYYMSDMLKVKKPKLPIQPTQPIFPKATKITKGEFETTYAFKNRIQQEKNKINSEVQKIEKEYKKDVDLYNSKVKKLSANYNKKVKYLQSNIKKVKTIALSKSYGFIYGKPKLTNIKYDADKQKFYAKLVSSKKDLSYDIELNVPLNKAKEIKKKLSKALPKVTYSFKNNKLILSSIRLNIDKEKYLAYISKESVTQTEYLVNFDTKKFNNSNSLFLNPTLINNKIDKNVQVNGYGINKSLYAGDDLNRLLAYSKQKKLNQNSYAIVVGIENYDFVDKVNYSSNSANMFSKYLHKIMGVPTDNIWTFSTKSKTTTGYLKTQWGNFIETLNKDSIVYFYYSGHGIASARGDAHLLPSDTDAKNSLNDKEMKLTNIYKSLENTKAKHIYAFIDSCYSGKNDKGELIIKGVAPILRVKKDLFNKSKITVFTAGRNSDMSNQYEEKNHRLFSYYLMKGLSLGKVNIEDLYKYVKVEVSKKARKLGDRHIQIPQLDGSKYKDFM